MGYMIITKSKKDKMSDLVEEMLYAGGRLMTCLEELSEDDSEMGYRNNYGNRYGSRYGMRTGYGMRNGYGNRYDDDDEMNERSYRRRY